MGITVSFVIFVISLFTINASVVLNNPKPVENVDSSSCLINGTSRGWLTARAKTPESSFRLVCFLFDQTPEGVWSVEPAEHTDGLFKIRNVQFNEYLTAYPIRDDIAIVISEEICIGCDVRFLWKFENHTQSGFVHFIHNSTGWYMDGGGCPALIPRESGAHDLLFECFD